MASKQIKARKVGSARRATDAAHRVLLAGLGAASLTQKRAAKTYQALVIEGTALQRRVRTSATKFYGQAQTGIELRLRPLSKKASQLAASTNARIEANIAAVLTRLGVAPKANVSTAKAKAGTRRPAPRRRQLKRLG